MNNRLFAGLVLAGICGFAVQAPAASANQVRTERVSLAGLDLTTPAGVAMLHRKVSRAVRIVCDVQLGNRDLTAYSASRRCSKATMARAEQQMGTAIAIANTRKNNQLAAISIPATELR